MANESMGGPFEGQQHEGMRERVEHAISDKASDVKDSVSDRTSDIADRGKTRIAEALENVAERAHQRADSLSGRGGVAGRIAEPAHRAAQAVESGAEYLHNHEWQEIRQDLEHQIRGRPLASVAVAFGAGLLLARAFGGNDTHDDRPRRGRTQKGGKRRSLLRGQAMAPVRRAVIAGVTSVLANQLRQRVGNGQTDGAGQTDGPGRGPSHAGMERGGARL